MTTSILWELDSTQKIINLKVQNIHTYHPLCKTKRNLITSTERPKMAYVGFRFYVQFGVNRNPI